MKAMSSPFVPKPRLTEEGQLVETTAAVFVLKAAQRNPWLLSSICRELDLPRQSVLDWATDKLKEAGP